MCFSDMSLDVKGRCVLCWKYFQARYVPVEVLYNFISGGNLTHEGRYLGIPRKILKFGWAVMKCKVKENKREIVKEMTL